MIFYDWTHIDIKADEDRIKMIDHYLHTKIEYAGFDTETTGLHIIHDKPFLFQFGYTDGKRGWTYAVDIQHNRSLALKTIRSWNAIVKSAPWYAGWNVKFDLNMLANIGTPYTGNNITDGTAWLRLGADAINDREGGVTMKLKQFAAQYIDSSARTMESKLADERREIASALNLKLKNRLHWTKKKIDEFFNDKINDAEDLPEKEREIYNEWLHNDVPEYLRNTIRGAVDPDNIRYDTLNRDTVIYYGHLDIVWTLEALHILEPIVNVRGNLPTLLNENAQIYPTLKMERAGLKINSNYLFSAKRNMKDYVLQRRRDLTRLAGKPIKCTQSLVILNILQNDFKLNVDSTNSETLDLTLSSLKRDDPNNPAIEFIETLQELRTLEKWYAVYICRFCKDLIPAENKIWTTINLEGTVSGRVTSDFQQFPKEGISTLDGVELFHPRKLVVAEDGDYKAIIYLDYSALELRLQAFYTILCGHPDMNMCRAYSPWKCHLEDGTPYDCTSAEHRKLAKHKELWFQDEDNEPWIPVDLHGAMTKIAFGIAESDPQWHELRYKGKRVNFAKNYGAGYEKICTMFPEYSEDKCHEIDSAYYKAFPGVKEYHKWVYNEANKRAYMQNVLGRRYYGANAHKLRNMLVQGSGADTVKKVILAVNKYLDDNNYKSKVIMQIHDELQIAWHKDDPPEIFFEIQDIMGNHDYYVPLFADMEVTVTTWEAKQEVTTIEELKEILYNGRTQT